MPSKARWTPTVAANGRSAVTRAHAGAIAESSNGDVRVGEVTRGTVVETSLGDLEVGIPENTAAWLEDNGVDAGGLFSGAEVAKSAAHAAKWGGQAGVAFDPNYHRAGDDIDNLDLNGWEQLADGGAHVTAMLADDRNLRETLAGGATAAKAKKSAKATAKARKAKRLSKARKAALGAYLGDRAVR